MYQVGDLIIYGGEGVCRVAAVGPAPIAAADPGRLYYTLTPVYRKGVVYAPTDVDVPMRPALSREEALSLIRSIPTMDQNTLEFADAKQAALEYKALLQTYDHGNLLRLIRAIYAKNERAIVQGKSYSHVDEKFLKRARELLHGELAVSLGVEPDEVERMIREAVEADSAAN